MKRLVLVLSIALSLVANNANAFALKEIVATGPGDHIHGMDISYWQHPSGSTIDFKKMYAAGIRFVMIKGADAHDAADAQALKYLKIDRPAAQAARLYTGFYYYAYLPDSTDSNFIIKDATAQAQKVIWRIASIGGYNFRDLPVSLDLENNCVRTGSNGKCSRYMNRDNVTLWAKTWLNTVRDKTFKKPFIYSYANFLEQAITRDAELRQYPLWMAHYTLNPASAQPNQKSVGCYAHAWTNANCTANWQMWQYTSCGIAEKYGVPGNRVDLNIFAGTSRQFLKLMSRTWVPDESDMLPVNEPTTMSLLDQTSRDTNSPVTITVDVTRPDGSPVVAGTINFQSADSTQPNGTQSVTRAATGRFILSITGLAAGNYVGAVNFLDITGTHAANQIPITFSLTQGATPTPTPTPTATKSPKPPVDSCAGQIRI
jgi:GH25 family lysozyme M1 (1,4-beta-N-acetylmuramidase)